MLFTSSLVQSVRTSPADAADATDATDATDAADAADATGATDAADATDAAGAVENPPLPGTAPDGVPCVIWARDARAASHCRDN